jgi:hypothetical protein
VSTALRTLVIGAVCALGLAAFSSPALALSPVVANCQHSGGTQLTEHFSISQLQNALATMPADVKEYSSCYAIIQNQLFKQVGGSKTGSGSGSGASSGSSFLSVPVIIVLLVIVLGGGGAAYAASKRNSGGGG